MAHSYLRIRGTLLDNMTFQAQPGLESTRARSAEAGDKRYELILLDAMGKPLLRMNPKASERTCGHVGHDGTRTRISAYVPLHPSAARFELTADGIVAHGADIPKDPPAPPKAEAEATDSGVILKWRAAEKASGDRFYSVVAAMDKGPRITLGRDLRNNAFSLDWKETPLSGEGTILLVVSDGIRSSEIEAYRFKRPVAPPTAIVVSPRGEHRYGQPLSLVGAVVDVYGNHLRPERVEWRVNDKVVARDNLLAAADYPEAGKHKLALIAWVDGVEVSADQALTIAEPTNDSGEWADAASLPKR